MKTVTINAPRLFERLKLQVAFRNLFESQGEAEGLKIIEEALRIEMHTEAVKRANEEGYRV